MLGSFVQTSVLYNGKPVLQSINYIVHLFKQDLIIRNSEGVAWLPSLHLNCPFQAFRSIGCHCGDRHGDGERSAEVSIVMEKQVLSDKLQQFFF